MATEAAATKSKGGKPMTGGQKGVLALTAIALTGAAVFYERNTVEAALRRRMGGATPPRPPAPYGTAPTGPVARAPAPYTPPAAVRQPLTPTGSAYGHAPNTTADRNSVQTAQRQLNDLGHSPGAIDGRMGQRTRDAILAFLRAPCTGQTPAVTSALTAYTNHPRGDVDGNTQGAVFGLIEQCHAQASGVAPAAPPAAVPRPTYPPTPTQAPARSGRPVNDAAIPTVGGAHRQALPIPGDVPDSAVQILFEQLQEMGFNPGTPPPGQQFIEAVNAFRAATGTSAASTGNTNQLATAVDAVYARHV